MVNYFIHPIGVEFDPADKHVGTRPIASTSVILLLIGERLAKRVLAMLPLNSLSHSPRDSDSRSAKNIGVKPAERKLRLPIRSSGSHKLARTVRILSKHIIGRTWHKAILNMLN